MTLSLYRALGRLFLQHASRSSSRNPDQHETAWRPWPDACACLAFLRRRGMYLAHARYVLLMTMLSPRLLVQELYFDKPVPQQKFTHGKMPSAASLCI